MTKEAFSVPDLHRFAESLGVDPVEIEADTQEIDLEDVTGESLRFSFSTAGRSIRLLWTRESGTVDIFREGATRLWIEEGGRETILCTEFATGSIKGSLRLRVFPHIELKDELLFS
ncbi:hypothetical protein [Streptomyces sp. NRRL B-24572]|uniref:hypothetical protein n=1 Tax=Streptomyces sp. NRRL B-24572 TaxID=1962156 RepID=UPI000A3C6A03|nr:hypothetical protein [Streptomyces sp. NRRL B-24572]